MSARARAYLGSSSPKSTFSTKRESASGCFDTSRHRPTRISSRESSVISPEVFPSACIKMGVGIGRSATISKHNHFVLGCSSPCSKTAVGRKPHAPRQG